MPIFMILRIQIEDNPLIRGEVQYKFFPIKTPGLENSFQPMLILAETPPQALKWAIKRFPYLRLQLAVEEKSSYDATFARLATYRTGAVPPRGPNPRREDKSPASPSPALIG